MVDRAEKGSMMDSCPADSGGHGGQPRRDEVEDERSDSRSGDDNRGSAWV